MKNCLFTIFLFCILFTPGKSFIVAKQHIDNIEGNRIMIADHSIPIGKIYKTNISNLLG